MFWSELHSGQSLGTGLARRATARKRYAEGTDHATSAGVTLVRTVRVVTGSLGPMTRLSATELDIVVDGSTLAGAWSEFLAAVGKRDDAPWLVFDFGPLRATEMVEAFDAPEDEDWSEPVDGAGDNS